ncbi:unannotated protein [freshwater metagenome]|uniref:Unannotated protein n=1 Tax=freshwater metagenome TaxID=449393 RepID=A0A6J5Z7Z2_9ZZZZ
MGPSPRRTALLASRLPDQWIDPPLRGDLRRACIPAVETGRNCRHVPWLPALRSSPRRRKGSPARRARTRALHGDADRGNRCLERMGRQTAYLHLRLHHRRDLVRSLPLGLSLHRDSGLHDSPRPARARALAPESKDSNPYLVGARRSHHHLAAALAGRRDRSNSDRGGAAASAAAPWQTPSFMVDDHRGWDRRSRSGDLLLVAFASRPRLEARGRGQPRRRSDALGMAMVGCRRDADPARAPGRLRLPTQSAGLAGRRAARLATGDHRRLFRANRHLPLPQLAGPDVASGDPRRDRCEEPSTEDPDVGSCDLRRSADNPRDGA